MGAFSSVAAAGLNAALADQASKRQSRKIDRERDQKIEAIQQREREELKEATRRLRQQLASRRAKAAFRGVNESDSTSALLNGLERDSDEANLERATGAKEQIQALNRQARTAKRRNLLDLANSVTQNSLTTNSTKRRRKSLLDI